MATTPLHLHLPRPPRFSPSPASPPARTHAGCSSPLDAASMAPAPAALRWRFSHALRKLASNGSRYSTAKLLLQHQQQQQRLRASGAALAVWKQEVLWTEAPVVEVERETEQLFHVVLDVSSNPELMTGHTNAGQFIQVRVGDSKPAFMAIASPPKAAASGVLEFLIKYVQGSTAGLLCTLGKGDRVELSQVMGSGFRIERLHPPEEYSTVLLFATGSGISPVRSLIEAGFEAHKRSDVRLYYGASNLQKMAYQDKFKVWESSGVKIIPVLSQPGDNWSGERGYVQAAFSKAKSISEPLQTGAVLCGQKEMAQDVTSLLIAEGVSQENILKNF